MGVPERMRAAHASILYCSRRRMQLISAIPRGMQEARGGRDRAERRRRTRTRSHIVAS